MAYVNEDMILSSYRISKKDKKIVICDHCNTVLNHLTAKVHMKRHYLKFISRICRVQQNNFDEDSKEDITMDESEVSEEFLTNHNNNTMDVSEGTQEDFEHEEYPTNICSLPPEVLFHVCKYLEFNENINLDFALGGNFVSKTGIKLYIKKKYEMNRKMLENSLRKAHELIEMYLCCTYKIGGKFSGKFTIREPLLVINSTNKFGGKTKTMDFYLFLHCK